MIHTKEPANKYHVYVSAFRSNEPRSVNVKNHMELIVTMLSDGDTYGQVLETMLEGYYRESGSQRVTMERTAKVLCDTKEQVINIAKLATCKYHQECVLVVKTQTHTAGLVSWSVSTSKYKAERLHGSLQVVSKPKGENYTVDTDGNFWEVV